jgi:diadenosine tetraphosphatase ApaH/serine/threonine PP2A family protein phosphatase
MRVAVISDVHANRHALDVVLEALEAERPDAVWCLGDTVGYGPQPNECCELVRPRADLCLVGNHDLVALGDLGSGDFNEDAAAAARWTAKTLDDDSREFLSGLKPLATVEGVDLFHASARDPVWEYILTEEAAATTFQLADAELILVGHSHIALALREGPGGAIGGGLAPDGTEVELEGRWLLNPGSVGQPRDGDPRAAWLLLDLERRFASFRRVKYPVDKTQAEMREQGLPSSLVLRLARGE